MAYTVIARKYRPLLFENIIGQEHISQTLVNALKQQRVAHAFIFSGPRGVGKTTTARILSKAVNCEKQPALNPCNKCDSCISITKGNSMDVIEIDGASNRGIDEVRNIRDSIRFAPAHSKYKIYIIDEVHMLTRDAFNALLKTLEEPPAHAMFIFATTEIHKLPLTILSRCQRYDFRRISTGRIQSHLKIISDEEKVNISEEALFLIARKADGSMRDSQSILDQIISFSDNEISEQDVRSLLGLIDEDLFFNLTDVIHRQSTPELLKLIHQIISTGHDLNDFLLQFEEHLKNLLIVHSLNDTSLLDITDVFKDKFMQQREFFTEDQILHMMGIISDIEPRLKNSSMPQLLFEMTLLKLLKIPELSQMDKILGFITALKKAGGKVEIKGDMEESAAKSQQLNRAMETLNEKNENNEKKEEIQSSVSESTQSGDITVEKIRQQWQEFTTYIGEFKKQNRIKSFLNLYYPYQLKNNILALAVNKKSDSKTIRTQINQKREELRKWLHEFFKISMDFQIVEMDFKEAGIDWVMMTPKQLLESLKENSEDIKL
ncbi:MAG: DNA polymerase III subunit gamma/tau, partial [Calditrichia bacterium]|nr:DNA polymerase III subunit gamma/tau [Calditrichia bacterium]